MYIGTAVWPILAPNWMLVVGRIVKMAHNGDSTDFSGGLFNSINPITHCGHSMISRKQSLRWCPSKLEKRFLNLLMCGDLEEIHRHDALIGLFIFICALQLKVDLFGYPLIRRSLATPQSATKIMKHIIENFTAYDLFGRENYEYYARVTGRVLRVQDEWIFSFRYPPPPRGKSAQQNYARKWSSRANLIVGDRFVLIISAFPPVQLSLQTEKTWLQCECDRWGLSKWIHKLKR